MVPSKTVRNERIKLRANALDSVAVASVAAGFVTPLAALSFGMVSASTRSVVGTISAALVWLAMGLLLHYIAGKIIGGLQE